jgi:hypothetical protein
MPGGGEYLEGDGGVWWGREGRYLYFIDAFAWLFPP